MMKSALFRSYFRESAVGVSGQSSAFSASRAFGDEPRLSLLTGYGVMS